MMGRPALEHGVEHRPERVERLDTRVAALAEQARSELTYGHALVLVMVETTDLIFAVDSIPAIFGVTTKPFIVFTSNVFAILGLRSLYFVLAGAIIGPNPSQAGKPRQ